jgi:hypothetical protein
LLGKKKEVKAQMLVLKEWEAERQKQENLVEQKQEIQQKEYDRIQ